MRLMAVATGNPTGEHFALLERAVIVDLIAHLAVGVIETPTQRRDAVSIGKPLSGYPILRDGAAARMAQAASLDLLAQRRWSATALRLMRLRALQPEDAPALAESNQQSHCWVGAAVP